jgi:membrane-bound acyltransferase YfiQ involved in biofilm formation
MQLVIGEKGNARTSTLSMSTRSSKRIDKMRIYAIMLVILVTIFTVLAIAPTLDDLGMVREVPKNIYLIHVYKV